MIRNSIKSKSDVSYFQNLYSKKKYFMSYVDTKYSFCLSN